MEQDRWKQTIPVGTRTDQYQCHYFKSRNNLATLLLSAKQAPAVLPTCILSLSISLQSFFLYILSIHVFISLHHSTVTGKTPTNQPLTQHQPTTDLGKTPTNDPGKTPTNNPGKTLTNQPLTEEKQQPTNQPLTQEKLQPVTQEKHQPMTQEEHQPMTQEKHQPTKH